MADNKSTLGSLLFVICFVIGCLFLYWAVEYWVHNNFDKGRYEISKIQPATGTDSMSFWKLDRRTGTVEYCSLEVVKDPNDPTVANDPARGKEFNCIRANVIAPKEKEYVQPSQPQTTEKVEAPAEQVVTTTAPEAAPVEPQVTPEVTTTPAAPQQ